MQPAAPQVAPAKDVSVEMAAATSNVVQRQKTGWDTDSDEDEVTFSLK